MQFRVYVTLACALITLVLSACSENLTASASQSGPMPAGPIRLGAMLASAKIESPVRAVRAAHSLKELGDVARETLLEESFDEFDPKAAGWRVARGSGLIANGAGQAFQLRGLGRGARYGWVFPVEPGTYYHFERSVRAEQPPDVDFAVVEAKGMGGIGLSGPFANHYMAGRGLALKVHWPDAPVADGKWQRGSTSFFTTPATQALAIVVRPTISQQAGMGAQNSVSFDDIRLERIDPTPQQAIALFKARTPAPGADPELGIEKFGQFPPLGEIEGSHGPADDNFSYRYALYAPPPTTLGFELRIPQGAVLHFAVSLARETPAGDGARFELIARSAGDAQSLWTRDVTATGDDWRWHAERVALDALVGRNVVLELRTTALQGHPHPVWGHPVIDVPYTGAGPRNVILIAVDTLRADHLSCYGYERQTTPRLDALAADGVRFEHVASNCNWTCPSFASIFTGMVPSRHGVYSYGPRTPLPGQLETLAERFHAAGWATEAIAYKPPLYDGGFEQGFDIAFNVPREAVRGEDNLTEALEWLDANAERRNFLFLHFNDPHQPFTQPAPYDTMYGGDPGKHGIELPYSIYTSGYPKSAEQRGAVRDLYDGEVAYVDNRIGVFLDALKKRGLYDDAVIGFVSDHGEQLWEHGGFGHGPSFGGSGNLLFDEVVRVPLIVKPSAGGFAAGETVRVQISGFDIMPTLLELAGIPTGNELDAQSLVPLMTPASEQPGIATPGERPAPVDRIAITETSGRSLALRNPHWKYLLSYGRRAKERLFDLDSDPLEKTDVAQEKPEQVALLRAQAIEYLMLKRSGHYLVVIGESAADKRQLSATGATSSVTLHGLDSRANGEGGVTFKGSSSGQLWLVALLEVADTLRMSRTGLPASAQDIAPAVRYRPGDLERLLRAGAPGVTIFLGPPPLVAPEASRRTIDARQLEALKAMGYTGEDDDDDDER